MFDNGMRAADEREYADRIREMRAANQRDRRARRHARFRAVTDFVLSIPPGIAVRIGG